MSYQYFRTSNNILVYESTASMLMEVDGQLKHSDIAVIISIHATIKEQKTCYKARVIEAGFVKGEPFSKEWLKNLENKNYGVEVTEYTNGPVVYYFDEEQLLHAVVNSFSDGVRLKSQYYEQEMRGER